MNTANSFQTTHAGLWRFVQFPLTRIVIATASLVMVIVLLQGLDALMQLQTVSLPAVLAAVLLTIAALMATYVAYVRLIECRPVIELATKRAVREFATGFVVGGFLFCVVMLILWLAGVATIAGDAGWTATILALLSALELAVVQAIFFWGIVFRIVEKSLGTWIALALSIIVFGAAHAGGAGASVISEVTIGLAGGALLAAAYVYTRRLWMTVGIIAALDFTEAGVFGVSTAGHKESGLFVSRFHGPDILTGGAAGPEVSIVTLLLCVTLAAVFFLLAHRKGHIVAPFWHRAPAEASALIGAR